jgi:hypothetical protein
MTMLPDLLTTKLKMAQQYLNNHGFCRDRDLRVRN